MLHRWTSVAASAFALLIQAGGASAVAHPFMLWTRDEAVAIRRRVETEPWAKARYQEMMLDKGRGQTFRNLFNYLVLGDARAGEAEKRYLLHIVGTHPRQFEKIEHGGRHYTCYLDALRYDAVYDLLSADERARVEETFRAYIIYQLEDKKVYTRTSWLPNMQWPRPMAAHIMAVALGDRASIEKLINGPAGFRWYLDEYVADQSFYMEEFGKHYSMIGEMLLFCRGLERLGLDAWGYGYTGRTGATMRKYVESVFHVGYPRIEIPCGMPHYGKITMGDAKGNNGFEGAPPYAFQHSIVSGYLPNGAGGNDLWTGANMNGRDHKMTKVDKMFVPLWFEVAHAKWPDAGFDYFLAQMRRPGTGAYVPTLFFGLAPVEAATVKPPPAPSYLAKERGFALLRAEEGPAYWESPAPAVAFQLATYYVHYVHDAFSLLGFTAFNRPIYLNRGIANGYAGGDPWSDSSRGHCGVTVDNLQWQIGENPAKDHPHWPNPIGPVPTRFASTPLVKFAAARSVPEKARPGIDDTQPLGQATLSVNPKDREDPERELWPGVRAERALLLTREYLFDVYGLTSVRPHTYQWAVHALGAAQAAPAWRPTDELAGRLYERNRQTEKFFAEADERARYELKDVHALSAGREAWSLTVLQTCALPDASKSVLGRAWYDRRVGVRVFMLPDAEGIETRAYVGRTPGVRTKTGKEKSKGERSSLPDEVGGTTLIVERKTASPTFVALHEPFEKGQSRIAAFRAVAQSAESVVASVTGVPGSGIDDRVMVSRADDPKKVVAIEGGGESFAFADWGFVRVGPETVQAAGDLRALRVKVSGTPKLLVNGQETGARIDAGLLVFGR